MKKGIIERIESIIAKPPPTEKELKENIDAFHKYCHEQGIPTDLPTLLFTSAYIYGAFDEED